MLRLLLLLLLLQYLMELSLLQFCIHCWRIAVIVVVPIAVPDGVVSAGQ